MHITYFIAVVTLTSIGSTSTEARPPTDENHIIKVDHRDHAHTHGEGYRGYLGNCTPVEYACPRSYYYDGEWHAEKPPYVPPSEPDEDRGLGQGIGIIIDEIVKR